MTAQELSARRVCDLQLCYVLSALVAAFFSLLTFLIVAYPAHVLGFELLRVYSALWLAHWAVMCADHRTTRRVIDAATTYARGKGPGESGGAVS